MENTNKDKFSLYVELFELKSLAIDNTNCMCSNL